MKSSNELDKFFRMMDRVGQETKNSAPNYAIINNRDVLPIITEERLKKTESHEQIAMMRDNLDEDEPGTPYREAAAEALVEIMFDKLHSLEIMRQEYAHVLGCDMNEIYPTICDLIEKKEENDE